MALTWANIRDKVESELQDASNAVFATAEIDYQMNDELKTISNVVPYISKVLYQFEGRSGTATSTSSNNLVDATQAHFLSGDTNKIIYNTTDKTWALITSYTSTSQVALSKDIMASGESYKIFNKNCQNSRQINIEDVTDYLWVVKAEFPVDEFPQAFRNIDSNETNIVTVGYDRPIGDTAESNTDKDVYLYFAKPHRVTQLTDTAGAVNNAGGYAAGSVSMAVNGLQATGTIEAGQEFTVAGIRGTYTVTADATITTNAATISFYPGLESAAEHTDVVTFKLSTLTPILETILVDLVAGETARSKATQPMRECVNAITVLATSSTAIGLTTARITQATTDIASGRTEADRASTLITSSAAGEFALMNAEIDQAISDLDSGRALINTLTTVSGAENDYISQANSVVNTAIGFMRTGQAYIQQAQADQKTADNFLSLAKAELQSATEDLNKGIGYIRLIQSYINVANSSNPLVVWGERKIADARNRLQRIKSTRVSEEYSRL